jgi:hypothetical protein
MNAVSVAQTKASASTINRKAAWAIILLLVAVVLAAAAIPVWIIQPFKSQTARGLEVAYALKSWSPLATAVASTVVLALALFLWRGARRWWRKAALVVTVALTLACAWFARQNHFEWMFNPLPHASFVKAGEASFVASGDQVLAVQINGEAAAYPVRQIAYHHVIQDEVGGTPIVATY